MLELFPIAFALFIAAIALVGVIRMTNQRLADKDQRFAEVTADKDKQIIELKDEVKTLRAEKDVRIAEKDARIHELNEQITRLERKIENKDDKAETMFGEMGDLREDLGINKGIYARPEADALQEQKLENIRKQPSPYDEPSEPNGPKPRPRGKRAQ